MTEARENNTVDKIIYVIKQEDDQTLIANANNDSDDLHICRKCNKVFKSLASYLEHKVKYENYNISETLSKLDRCMVLPHLDKNENEGVLEYARQNKAVILTHLEDINSIPLSSINVERELSADRSSRKKESFAVLEQKKSLLKDPSSVNRKRKRKQEAVSSQTDLEISYKCAICERKFRREASLRWHMNFGHKEGNKRDKGSANQTIRDDSSNNGNITVYFVNKEKNGHHCENDKEVHAVIEQPQNTGKLKTTKVLQDRDVSSQSHKHAVVKNVKDVKSRDSERPHVCNICGRSFKKMTALKTHGAVHSDDRKFVCTFKDCPYGFKLKGGLVRHMRRHTGERPYVCENCGRAFSESGALTRHMKSQQNCARKPGSAYPHYMKNWTHHPNIPAVLDPSQRDVRQRRKSKCDNSHKQRESDSQTQSDLDHIILQSAQNLKLKKNSNADCTRRGTVNAFIEQKGIKSDKLTSLVISCKHQLDSSSKKENIAELKQKDNLLHDPLQKKRSKKRGSVESNLLVNQSDLGKTYTCIECDKYFRREATFHQHIKYEHKKDKAKSNDEEITVNIFGENHKVFTVGGGEKENNYCLSEKVEHKPSQEIHVIVEQSENLEATDDLHAGIVSSQSHKQIVAKWDREAWKETADRPYMCDICGQRFKKMTALKTHGAVHSDDRKFVCTFKDCPYGFKLKGGLVRHMRRHTGERPYVCENCGRAFSESGALTRHMKSRRNCARTPDSVYHRYKKNWSYHPNIPAVMDPFQRCVPQGQYSEGDIHDVPDIIIEISDKPLDLVLSHQETATTEMILENHMATTNTSSQEHDEFYMSHELVDITNEAEVQLLKLMQCCVCKKNLGTVEGLEIHLRTHLADQSARCNLCHFLSHDKEELRLHILSMHHDSLKDIEASVLSVTEDGEEINSEIGQDKKTTTRDALNAVKQLYSLKKQKFSNEEGDRSSNGRLQCMVCNRFFALRSYLQQHMRTHIGDRPYKCHVCHRSFTARDGLKKHMYVHKAQRDFKCGECGKLFKRLTYLQQHLKIHTQERTIQCSLCDKMFRTQYSLTVHMRTHSGINPYKCHVCSKHFRERGSLRRHMRLHAGEKPYKCSICNAAFAENGTLSRHLKAKVPCSTKQTKLSVTNLDHNQDDNSNLLTQFSAVVANTQQYIQHVNNTQSFCLPTMHEGQETETLHIFDTNISESVIIVAEKAIVELI